MDLQDHISWFPDYDSAISQTHWALEHKPVQLFTWSSAAATSRWELKSFYPRFPDEAICKTCSNLEDPLTVHLVPFFPPQVRRPCHTSFMWTGCTLEAKACYKALAELLTLNFQEGTGKWQKERMMPLLLRISQSHFVTMRFMPIHEDKSSPNLAEGIPEGN